MERRESEEGNMISQLQEDSRILKIENAENDKYIMQLKKILYMMFLL